jgi:hypothetical protein
MKGRDPSSALAAFIESARDIAGTGAHGMVPEIRDLPGRYR